ncbi:MAG: flagellar basal body P-ring formation protein FlgA [Oligoflexales bacterium]|nr:flagellar basal body P-ring formation protein FlgA [Oligoflexales bacterium]
MLIFNRSVSKSVFWGLLCLLPSGLVSAYSLDLPNNSFVEEKSAEEHTDKNKEQEEEGVYATILARFMSEDDILEALRNEVKNIVVADGYRISIKKIVLPKKIIAPSSDFDLKFELSEHLSLENIQKKPYGFIKVQAKILKEEASDSDAFEILVMPEVEQKVLVWKDNKNKGDSIDMGSVKDQWIRFEPHKDNIQSLAAFQDMKLKFSVTAGQVLKSSQFEKVKLIKRGQNVRISLQSGSVLIQGLAKAMSEGGPGDSIDLVYPQTRKVIRGIIDTDGQVSIQSPMRM